MQVFWQETLPIAIRKSKLKNKAKFQYQNSKYQSCDKKDETLGKHHQLLLELFPLTD